MATLAQPRWQRDHRGRDPVEMGLARFWGVEPTTAHGRMYGPNAVNLLAAAVAQELSQRGEFERRERWLAPIFDACERFDANVPLDAIEIRAAKADADEEVIEKAFHLNPCLETLDRLIEAIKRERAAQLVRLRRLQRQRAGMGGVPARR